MMPGPPPLAAWLISRRVPEEWREFVLGDLEEEFHRRADASPAAARLWLWRQTIRCLAAPPPARRQTPAHPSRSRGDSIVQTLLSDVRYSVRSLFRTPSFALAVVAVLALGVGANTAIFSIVNAVLLRPLPFDEPERLVEIFHVPPQTAFPGQRRFAVSPANFYDWQKRARLFEGMAIYGVRGAAFVGGGRAENVRASTVGAGFFDVMHARAAQGRLFLPEEDAPSRGHVVVLSDAFWRSRFGAAPDTVGRTVKLDGEVYTVVGIMPAQFSSRAWTVAWADVWVPLAYSDEQRAVRENHNRAVVARLKPGVDVAQARAEMEAISERLEREYPKENTGWGATVVPLQELIVGDVRNTLVMLLAAVGLVLLIACANVGNLLFARGLTRRKEIAIRSALGASRARVFQQLLVEALLLAVAGGALGLLVARGSLAAASTLLVNQLPRAEEITMDVRVLLFALGASVVTGMLAGALPGLRAGRTNLNDALQEGGRSGGTLGMRTRRLLIACEVALSVMLLMGAGVMLRTVSALRGVDAGFDPHNVLALRVALPEGRYQTPAQRTAFFDEALQRIRTLPGVQAAGMIDNLPLTGGSIQPIVLEGRPELLPRDQPTVALRRITPGYLAAMRVPLLRGRDVSAADKDVMLISRSAAKLLWGDDDPIGRRVSLPLQSRTALRQVIGIVGDVKQVGLAQPAMPTVYQYTAERSWSFLTLVARTAVPPTSLAQSAIAAVQAIDREQPILAVLTMDEIVDRTLASQRLGAFVLTLFALLALVLASVGIYSVLSYIVRGRSREIGIRTALGARTGDVLRLVVGEGMRPALIGIAAGAVAAVGSAKLLENLVFGVTATDPATLAVVAVTLAVVALAASLVPAFRALRLDPLKVLRAD